MYLLARKCIFAGKLILKVILYWKGLWFKGTAHMEAPGNEWLTFSCARLKNCRLLLCSVFKMTSTDRHVPCTRPQPCSISLSSSLSRSQCVCYGNHWRNMATKLRTDHSCETLSVDYNKRKIDFILQKQQKGKKKVTTSRAVLNFWLKIEVIVCILLWPKIINRLLATSYFFMET